MQTTDFRSWCSSRLRRPMVVIAGSALAAGALAASAAAEEGYGHHEARPLAPGNVLISRSVFHPADITAGVTQLPPGCSGSNCGTAVADGGTYPDIFNNDKADGSFGVTSPLFLDELSSRGGVIHTIKVPPRDLVTSFSSKSEGALNLSTNGQDLTFIDYAAPLGAVDVSNSNTPWVVDPTNPVPGAYYRAVAEMDRWGRFHFTKTNAYSGNNGRAAILNNAANVFYAAGNAGNGANPQPPGVVAGAGAQIISPVFAPIWDQFPSEQPTPVGNFSITQTQPPNNPKPDKLGKDDNFRGLAVYNNVLYYTKGSGGNGINTVYFVDTTGTACPNGGVGLPVAGAKLPTTPVPNFDPTTGKPTNMCILKGFNTQLAKTDNNDFPFGLWFANPTTLYVADEGNGSNTYLNGQYSDAAAQTTAGLQKWVFDSGTGQWKRAYTLQSGLNLGQLYQVPGYPTGNNAATKLPWAPATDGLRNIAGRVNRNDTATIYAVTSTVSGSGDQGADPNEVVRITDQIAATSQPTGESFTTTAAPRFAQVYRGVSFTPGTAIGNQAAADRHGTRRHNAKRR